MMNNYDNSYSDSYRSQLRGAILRASDFGFHRPVLISEKTIIDDDTLCFVGFLLNHYRSSIEINLPKYFGDQCQQLSTRIFGLLNCSNILADIVVGNVIVKGVDEFECTSQSLMHEVQTAVDKLTQRIAIHAWVSLGDDTIIDAALPSRLVKHYGAPKQLADAPFIGRAWHFSDGDDIQYQPLLVGTELFGKINPPDPVELLEQLKKSRDIK